jgi:hypothetical protein
LLSGGIRFLKNFTLCDLNSFDVIISSFLDACKVNVLCNGNKVKACAKVGFKLMNSNMDYKWALVDVILNLVAFLNLKPTRLFVLLMQSEYGKETKLKVVG